MIYYGTGSEKTTLTEEDLRNGLYTALDKIGRKKKVLVVPPDITRIHSRAGEITKLAYDYYKKNLTDILPALGTHVPMTDDETAKMFPGIPLNLFRVHNWRNEVVTLGIIGEDFISEITEGKIKYPWPAQVNRLIKNGGHDLVLSVGQVVPHEVTGMANYTKNILVGTGGSEGINKSHYIGAVYGMERLLGKADNPVRQLLNFAASKYLNDIPVVYVLTVIGRDESGKLVTRGLFIGDTSEVFMLASDLSLKVNFTVLEKPIRKAVVYLDPDEFKSTWLGNKSIYRTRMAMADNGELIVIAPGLKEFGEDREIDRLVRKYGYRGTPATLKAVEENEELQKNLGAAAHLIHGSTEGRFSVTLCPGKLTKNEIESAGFKYADINEITKRYNPAELKDGFNTLPGGEEIYYISNPATGLWASKERLR
ncbi:MAG TPA: lactate racemase domain-containing protein [Bacteroidales bacterium]|nr:lactate racemase domain-containing protein [Bacteroidales bacterium]HRT90740.1 lactate racemase domain-containing protein [Bacteroidales bacterium]